MNCFPAGEILEGDPAKPSQRRYITQASGVEASWQGLAPIFRNILPLRANSVHPFLIAKS